MPVAHPEAPQRPTCGAATVEETGAAAWIASVKNPGVARSSGSAEKSRANTVGKGCRRHKGS